MLGHVGLRDFVTAPIITLSTSVYSETYFVEGVEPPRACNAVPSFLSPCAGLGFAGGCSF